MHVNLYLRHFMQITAQFDAAGEKLRSVHTAGLDTEIKANVMPLSGIVSRKFIL
jgi:hypothetical protein